MTHDAEEPLTTWGSGTHRSTASKRDQVVLKESGPWSPAVIALLRHLEDVGFEGAPRVVGSGVAPDGRMTLGYVPGTSAHPRAWQEGGCAAMGALLRRMHDATSSLELSPDVVWADTWIRGVGDEDDVVLGHGDAAPWNIVGPDAWPAALIDWDLAGPVRRVTEVAYAVWLNAQLYDDDIADLQGLPDASTRARQAAELVDAYGLPREQRALLVERMIELALTSARYDAIEHDINPDSTEAVSPDGYPVLWAITWRARSAAWMHHNRRLLTTHLSR